MSAEGGHAPALAERTTSTRPDAEPVDRLRAHRTARRVGLALLGLVVLLGLANVLGLRTRTATASDAGVEMVVTYAQVTRSGLATPWQVDIRSRDGFDGPVTITTSADYFERFDFNQWYPEASSTTVRGELLVLTFERPEGDGLRVRFDGRASPTFGLGSAATTALDTEGLPPLSVAYRTVVMP